MLVIFFSDLCNAKLKVFVGSPKFESMSAGAFCISKVVQARKLVQERVSRDGCDLFLAAMALEHECMHQETLCYMLAQQQKQHWEHLAEGGHLIVPDGVACRQPLTQVDNALRNPQLIQHPPLSDARGKV